MSSDGPTWFQSQGTRRTLAGVASGCSLSLCPCPTVHVAFQGRFLCARPLLCSLVPLGTNREAMGQDGACPGC